MIEYFLLLFAVPLGILLAQVSSWEKNIYKHYFPTILWVLAILSAIFLALDKVIGITLAFMFFTTLIWLKGN